MGVSPLDDVLDPGFLDGISALPIDEIRLRRRQASELEGDLSYLRRLVQGRLDILLDESRQRSSGAGSGDLSTLVRRLPEILGERAHGPGRGGLPMPLFPPDTKRDWLLRQDLVVDAERLATLSELDDADLQSRLSALAILEQRVSAKRRAIHGVIDQLQQELVRRYKTGEATVEGLLP
jgi:hypothetical protein